jgi:hypothetical protein
MTILPIDTSRLRAIRDRVAQATAGPWLTANVRQQPAGNGVEIVCQPGDTFRSDWTGSLTVFGPAKGTDADAVFIAAAREDVPLLLETVQRLQALNAELRSTIQELQGAGRAGTEPAP